MIAGALENARTIVAVASVIIGVIANVVLWRLDRHIQRYEKQLREQAQRRHDRQIIEAYEREMSDDG